MLRGLGVAMGRISGFHIDLRHRPYNTLALLCECVILMSLLAFCCLSKFSGIVLRKILLQKKQKSLPPKKKIDETKEPEARIHCWMTLTKNFGPGLPLLFKLHEIWSVDSQENH